MEVWRLHRQSFLPNDGTGALQRGGRYNSVGVLALYASLSASATILELRVHLEDHPVSKFHLSRTIISKKLLKTISKSEVEGWDDIDYSRTQTFGDTLLKDSSILGILVPSSTSRGYDQMVVLNPNHPEFAKLRWTSYDFDFDSRLWLST